MHKHLALALVLTAACRNAAPEPSAQPPAASPHETGNANPHAGLPAGHPPMNGMAMPAPAPTRELRWTDPVGWRRVQPSSSMRRAQYAIPGATDAENGELTVFYFGAGQGGAIDENVRRWQGQFSDEPGAPPAPPTQQRTVNNLRVHLTERFGRFNGGMAMPGAAPSGHDHWGMLGAIVETDQGPWFFKLTGPRATVEGARARFNDLVGSFNLP